jgi:uncharacterized protein
MKNVSGMWKGCWSALLFCTLLLAGCARTAPVSYYQLSPLKGVGSVPFSAEAGNVVLGIGPVRLPQYLDRPQLVTRLSPNRLQLTDGHRWAEPLSDNIPRVLGENLSALLGTDRILIHPWPASRTVDYQLQAEVLHFENESDGGARLVVLWLVKGKDGGIVLPEKRSSHLVSAASLDQEGQVSALNEALANFSREIGQELTTLLGKPSRSGL